MLTSLSESVLVASYEHKVYCIHARSVWRCIFGPPACSSWVTSIGDTSLSSLSYFPVEWEENNVQNWESGFFLYLIEEIYLLCRVRESNGTFILINVLQERQVIRLFKFWKEKEIFYFNIFIINCFYYLVPKIFQMKCIFKNNNVMLLKIQSHLNLLK